MITKENNIKIQQKIKQWLKRIRHKWGGKMKFMRKKNDKEREKYNLIWISKDKFWNRIDKSYAKILL